MSLVVPDGKTVYVSIANRTEFDAINLPETDHRTLKYKPQNLLTKFIDGGSDNGHGDVNIIFQHWL